MTKDLQEALSRLLATLNEQHDSNQIKCSDVTAFVAKNLQAIGRVATSSTLKQKLANYSGKQNAEIENTIEKLAGATIVGLFLLLCYHKVHELMIEHGKMSLKCYLPSSQFDIPTQFECWYKGYSQNEFLSSLVKNAAPILGEKALGYLFGVAGISLLGARTRAIGRTAVRQLPAANSADERALVENLVTDEILANMTLGEFMETCTSLVMSACTFPDVTLPSQTTPNQILSRDSAASTTPPDSLS